MIKIILIPKPGKDLNIESYRPMSLLPIITKVPERLLIKRIKSDPNTNERIPPHQFEFRELHSTVQQTHWITKYINKAFESKHFWMLSKRSIKFGVKGYC